MHDLLVMHVTIFLYLSLVRRYFNLLDTVLSLLSPRVAYSFQALLRGAYWMGGGGLIYFLRKLYDHFPPAQRNVCRTTMYSSNFNTTLNVFEMFNYIFFNYSTIYMF